MGKVMWMVLAGLFLAVGSVQADCGKCGAGDGVQMDHQAMVNTHIDKMTKELALTAEQKIQLEAIMKEKLAKKEQIMAQKEASMKALHEEFKVKVKGVLSEEQMKKWEANKESRDAKGDCPCKDKMCPECQKKNMAGHKHGGKK